MSQIIILNLQPQAKKYNQLRQISTEGFPYYHINIHEDKYGYREYKGLTHDTETTTTTITLQKYH